MAGRTTTLIVLAVGLIGVAGVSSANGEATAVAAKGKCSKKLLWKCAPKTLHLSVEAVYTYGGGASQTFSAEVEMKKRRAGPGEADYTQDGGTITLSFTGTARFSDLLPSCMSDVTYTVSNQTVAVPPAGFFEHVDFYLAFDFFGRDKGLYFIRAGDYLYPMISAIQVPGTVTCNADGSKAPFTYFFNGSREGIGAQAKGKPTARRLSGSAALGGDSFKWTLTKK